jgi:spore coat polysaccharide biosynthesis protein SpsF
MNYKTEQEDFWAGAFGDEYVKRSQGPELVASNIALFSKALRHTQAINSVLELGANVGNNMRALHPLLPTAELHALEINVTAFNALEALPYVSAVNGSILDYVPTRTFDLVLISGVLIHLDPEVLTDVYKLMFEATHRYILLAEYYNPTPVEVTYRGHRKRLFKRDFAGELAARYPSLQLMDYGFVYHLDPKWPHDDATWFLFEKKINVAAMNSPV